MTIFKINQVKKAANNIKFEVVWYGRLKRGEQIGIFNTEEQAAQFASAYLKLRLGK